jgi:hypothetical protein
LQYFVKNNNPCPYIVTGTLDDSKTIKEGVVAFMEQLHVYTMKDVMQILQLSYTTVYALCNNGTLPSVNSG